MLSVKILSFYKKLRIQEPLPKGIEVMNPYRDAYTLSLCEQFYQKYYHDDQSRTLMLGINPGRFGSGMTGISFTDPVKLENECGIQNSFPKKAELSSDFIYRMIAAFGGPGLFYNHYFISAVSPLGFTCKGKNINYYDDRRLEKIIQPFIIKSLNQLMAMGFSREKCYCIGEGKNFEYLNKINQDHGWFKEILPLSHPRFIMQYKRKQLKQYIDQWCSELSAVTS